MFVLNVIWYLVEIRPSPKRRHNWYLVCFVFPFRNWKIILANYVNPAIMLPDCDAIRTVDQRAMFCHSPLPHIINHFTPADRLSSIQNSGLKSPLSTVFKSRLVYSSISMALKSWIACLETKCRITEICMMLTETNV